MQEQDTTLTVLPDDLYALIIQTTSCDMISVLLKRDLKKHRKSSVQRKKTFDVKIGQTIRMLAPETIIIISSF